MENRGFVVHAHSALGVSTLSDLIEQDERSGRGLFEFCRRGVIFDGGPIVPTPGQLAEESRCGLKRLTTQAALFSAARANKTLAPEVNAIWTPIYLLCLFVIALLFGGARQKAMKDA